MNKDEAQTDVKQAEDMKSNQNAQTDNNTVSVKPSERCKYICYTRDLMSGKTKYTVISLINTTTFFTFLVKGKNSLLITWSF